MIKPKNRMSKANKLEIFKLRWPSKHWCNNQTTKEWMIKNKFYKKIIHKPKAWKINHPRSNQCYRAYLLNLGNKKFIIKFLTKLIKKLIKKNTSIMCILKN